MNQDKKIIIALLLGLFSIALGGFLLHLKIHSEVAWLPYLMLFDAIVVTLMFYFKKTAVFALFLNSIFIIIGVGNHLKFLPGGWSDILLSLPDLLMGYAVYVLVSRKGQEEKIAPNKI